MGEKMRELDPQLISHKVDEIIDKTKIKIHTDWRTILEANVKHQAHLSGVIYEIEKEIRLCSFFEFSKRATLRAMLGNKKRERAVTSACFDSMLKKYLKEIEVYVS
jgi:hypothetical protein